MLRVPISSGSTFTFPFGNMAAKIVPANFFSQKHKRELCIILLRRIFMHQFIKKNIIHANDNLLFNFWIVFSRGGNTLRILVATDCHLGYLEKDEVRRFDSFATFEEICSLAVKNKVHNKDLIKRFYFFVCAPSLFQCTYVLYFMKDYNVFQTKLNALQRVLVSLDDLSYLLHICRAFFVFLPIVLHKVFKHIYEPFFRQI